MKKYIIEDEIDFYKELDEVMNIKTDKHVDGEKDEEFCLITKTHLNDKFVTLSCGHSFNYTPLYNEIYTQIYVTNSYYSKKLKGGFKCPYCRQIQHKVLPYYSDLNLPIICGINTEDIAFYLVKDKYNNLVYNNELNFFDGICSYIDNTNEQCKQTLVILYKETNKCYCYSHIKDQKLKHKKALKEKQKIELKEKQKILKEEKQNAIKELKAAQKAAIVVSTCSKILKSGKNKGKPCGCKAFKDDLCKKHGTINDIIV
jgi:hypothetical protein